ncbi:hypothetical protein K469DRAFT_464354, partial [Zopfia rhizophila CBS 207.26]
ISTSLSSSGWLAAATRSKVLLYCLKNMDPPRKVPLDTTIEVTSSKRERIREIALSDDLLAILTYSHLIVYEYREPGNIERHRVANEQLDQAGAWTPKSLSISQNRSVDEQIARPDIWAWIAVGGQGENAVKIFKFIRDRRWNLQNRKLMLKCASNTGSINFVGFSTNRSSLPEASVIFGITNSNEIHCWDLRKLSQRDLFSTWQIDGCQKTNQSPNRGGITSATIFLSQSGRPYIFCTADQKAGSELSGSFIAPIGSRPPQRHILQESAIGRNVLHGSVASNGIFSVVIEDEEMRLLTLRGVNGGLTCRKEYLRWPSKLKNAATGVSGLSITILESHGKLNIVAVDCWRNILSREINVPGLP